MNWREHLREGVAGALDFAISGRSGVVTDFTTYMIINGDPYRIEVRGGPYEYNIGWEQVGIRHETGDET